MRATGPSIFLAFCKPANQSEGAERVLKLASKETYITDLMDGCLYMNAAGYYHGATGEQGDSLEASLSYGMDIYDAHQLRIIDLLKTRTSTELNR